MNTVVLRGVRQHNLRDLDLDLPLGCLIAFTGVSGSGKSSLALDTLHAEGRRRYLEALSSELRHAARGLSAPDADHIGGLPPTVALEQRARAPGPRVTVGTASAVRPILAVVAARQGLAHCPDCGHPVRVWAHDAIVGALGALPAGTRLLLEAPVALGADPAGVLGEIARAGFSRVRVDGAVVRVEGAPVPQESLRVVVDRVKVRLGFEARLHDSVRTAVRAGQGAVVAVTPAGESVYAARPVCLDCGRELPPLTPALVSFRSPRGACPTCRGTGRVADRTCPDCLGSRLRPEARGVTLYGERLVDLEDLGARALAERVAAWPEDPIAGVARGELRRRLEVLVRLGLGELPLATGAQELSAGQRQLLRLARQVGSRLSGVLYVLDEPTAGLDAVAAGRVVGVLRELVDSGSTVIAVTHWEEVVWAADYLVDFGPGAGARGGEVVYEGPPAGHTDLDRSTGRWLAGRIHTRSLERAPRGYLRAGGRDVPLGCLVGVTGPMASGKTRLLGALAGAAGELRVVTLEEGTGGRSVRSMPATFAGVWTPLRGLLASTREAKLRGLDAGHFSLSRPGGRCEACRGLGEIRVELGPLPEVWLRCEVCDGQRFSGDVRAVRWRGHGPHELLDLRAEDAAVLMAGLPRIDAPLRALVDVGLGYVPLGQPGHTLSGGEARRLRLARELAGRAGEGTLFLLDTPALGLHAEDQAHLVSVLQRLVDAGSSVVLATVEPLLLDACDVRIDLCT